MVMVRGLAKMSKYKILVLVVGQLVNANSVYQLDKIDFWQFLSIRTSNTSHMFMLLHLFFVNHFFFLKLHCGICLQL